MMRPLPPELVALGDQLETAVGRALGRRRSRRQLVLNAVASAAVAIPLVVSLAGRPATVPDAPTQALPDRSAQAAAAPGRDALPPRVLARLRSSAPTDPDLPNPDLRRALR